MPLTIVVNGRNGLLYEIRGTINDLRVAYYFAVIDTDKHFHQVGIWTHDSEFAAKLKS